MLLPTCCVTSCNKMFLLKYTEYWSAALSADPEGPCADPRRIRHHYCCFSGTCAAQRRPEYRWSWSLHTGDNYFLLQFLLPVATTVVLWYWCSHKSTASQHYQVHGAMFQECIDVAYQQGRFTDNGLFVHVQKAEVVNGRIAMVAFALLIAVETWKAGPGLVP